VAPRPANTGRKTAPGRVKPPGTAKPAATSPQSGAEGRDRFWGGPSAADNIVVGRGAVLPDGRDRLGRAAGGSVVVSALTGQALY